MLMTIDNPVLMMVILISFFFDIVIGASTP
jgi:hypothetical protein